MANPEHLEILKQGIEVWNKWREEHPDMLPDLEGANLKGAKLGKLNLSDAHLNYADLSDAHLNGTYLFDANLVNANLTGTRLPEAHLIGANLTGADLSDAHLTGTHLDAAHLSRTRLNGASLDRTYLNGADLTGADLSWADLFRAKLYGARLNGANLGRAYLNEVYLNGADLSSTSLHYTYFSSLSVAQADFTEARLQRTIFADTDLSEARGLETVIHEGPSTIGADTILRSKGEIPETFLRGAGITEDMILYIRTLRGKAIEFYSCFISYSHKDKPFARRLHDTLQGRGIRCWLDEHQLLPGDKFFEQIDRGIKLWDKVLLCCSEAALKSWWVNDEIERALAKEQRLMRERGRPVLSLIPLDLDGYLHDWDSGKAELIRSRFAPSFEGWERDNSIFEGQIERVVKALMTEEAGRESPPPPRL